MSAGFLEPLEASAIVLVELSASMIAEQLPANREVMDVVAKRFNNTFEYRWDRIIDFLKLHYILTKRNEVFWQDMSAPETVSDSLKDLLALWKYQTPGDRDFTSNNEVFPAASYQYVLYGMGFESAVDEGSQLRDQQLAEANFDKNKKMIEQALVNLPRHRELIDKVYEYGFQSI